MAHRTVSLSAEQARWFRIRRSGLDRPFATAELAATALVGVQAQILPAAGLALWNRSVGLTNAAFEDALFNRRSLVKLWGQRNTLHIYTSTDWPLLCAARALNRTWWERSVENGSSEFADYRHLVEEVAALLRQRESMGRSDLRASGIDLHEELYSAWGGIFADLVRLGYACHAGRDGSEGRFAHRERWLPDLAWNPPDPQAANLEVARRFFAAYGPASATDFAYWRGGSTPLARGWVSALHDSLCIVAVDGQSMLALARTARSSTTSRASRSPRTTRSAFASASLARSSTSTASTSMTWSPTSRCGSRSPASRRTRRSTSPSSRRAPSIRPRTCAASSSAKRS
jgi:hypothetical protein